MIKIKCAVCQKEIINPRINQVSCGGKCLKEYQKQYLKQYQKSDKYKQYQKQYQKQYLKQYQKSDKYKQYQKQYQKSDKYKQYKKQYYKLRALAWKRYKEEIMKEDLK